MIDRVFRSRDEAGAQLADAVADVVEGPSTVLGVPRGGIAVAKPVAEILGAPLDVVIPRKLGAPGNPELAIGAVAPGVMVLHERAVRQLGVPREYIEQEAARQEEEIRRREAAYRGGREPAEVRGRPDRPAPGAADVPRGGGVVPGLRAGLGRRGRGDAPGSGTVRFVELSAAGLFGLLGVRSLIHWLRRPMESDHRRDHVLYALFVLSRVGLWFALAGLFLLYATVDTQGRAFADDVAAFRWYFVVLLIPAALQFVSGFLLGRGPPGPAPHADPDGDRPV
jgi:hypothetical protein